MTPREAHDLLKDVQADYIGMVHEMNRIKRLVKPVDPWKLPLVERMEKGICDLRLAAGIQTKRTS